MSFPIARRAAAQGLLGGLIAAGPAMAQGYPSRPVRLVVPFPPGGGVDAVARILAEPLGTALGQPVIIENRAGAGGAIGVDSVAKAPPDGHALSMVSPGNMTAGPVVRPTPYDPLGLGFVSMLARSPLLLVCRNSLPAQDLAAFVALLRRQPDAIRFASGGVGTGTHLAAELMNLRLGVRMVHVPYRGTAPALTDLVAGNVDIFFSDTSAWPMVQQGQLRLLAVSSAATWATSPGTPSVGSAVPDFDISNWYGLVAPPGTPAPVRDRLAAELAAILARAEVATVLGRIGFDPAPMPPDAFGAFVRAELETWRAVVQAANIRAD
ncbi:tripartite tricarboxylate transporter substrate binding protein [Roseomonas sp. PWR1]|uniref:Tripartite tricarboxylate transporter substrate binding protein n=1 Tax=Roseomonas nitratireducens TaxID=2820810 RepID=A0ABS4B0T4_9PROT|nr:tripartite tricarboxylate transporter substrate binding protein [Neoroseomonas nitratireducens]MBP0466467.1 tripartite tricarboxylate transporter substrate binding protein [Neoroseomonas nitratireducens]